jgi:multidrug efflux pump subunit AcrB
MFVDVDSSDRQIRQQKIYEYNYKNGGLFGTNASIVSQVGQLLFSDTRLSTLNNVTAPEEIDIMLSVDKQVRGGDHPFTHIHVPSQQSGIVHVTNVLNAPKIENNEVIHHKNLVPLNYITSELSGEEEAPVYGIMHLAKKMQQYTTSFMTLPFDLSQPVIKWDGEIFITLEVFRDLGIAFVFAMMGIYLLILTRFKSFLVPLVIMIPIPISLIGILFGHAITHTYFTATSMIGFMAGAGIIVRNSIILIDFIEHQMQQGLNLKNAVITSGILRFRPMLLTAAAVILGSLVMLKDPIFSGFAVSLIFGEMTATLLSRFMIPLVYYYSISLTHRSRGQDL